MSSVAALSAATNVGILLIGEQLQIARTRAHVAGGSKASKARRRGSLTSDLGEKTASQAKEIGQYVRSKSSILEKLLWFLNQAVLLFNHAVCPLQV